MHKLYFVKLFAYIVIICLITAQPLYAVGESILISQIQLGDKISAKNEFVELYNNGSSDQEFTDWCLYYQSISLAQNKMVCMTPARDDLHIFLPSHSHMIIVSNELALYNPLMPGDFRFSATLSGTGGYVKLFNGGGVEIDKVGWGNSDSVTNLAPIAPVGSVLSRKTLSEEILQDTDVLSDDFEIVQPKSTYTFGSIYEVEDLCTNLDGIQDNLPEGYELNENLECYLPPTDVCLNLEGIQTVLPDGFEVDDSGNCISYDECPNLEGIQASVPDGYIEADNVCKKIALPVVITELLPNPTDTDDGSEFIELFNPNNEVIELSNYQFVVEGKTYAFLNGFAVDAGGYASFDNEDIKFTLVNTGGNVFISSIDNSFVSDSISYTDAKEGLSWALIGDSWQYSNRPTPGNENLPSFIEDVILIPAESISELKPCPEGQERNPETNRCRKIVSESSSLLKPCKDGQYRSEETGRCRNIASDVAILIPCPEGQERNPETNRCRTIATVLGVSTLKPCPEGQERNPETNRCRKISGTMPVATYAPEKMSKEQSNPMLLWSLVALGAAAVCYGIWEWRKELYCLIGRIGKIISRSK